MIDSNLTSKANSATSKSVSEAKIKNCSPKDASHLLAYASGYEKCGMHNYKINASGQKTPDAKNQEIKATWSVMRNCAKGSNVIVFSLP